MLASSNVGLGHVEDARHLAKKFGDDPGEKGVREKEPPATPE